MKYAVYRDTSSGLREYLSTEPGWSSDKSDAYLYTNIELATPAFRYVKADGIETIDSVVRWLSR